jgi:hypothetical protein
VALVSRTNRDGGSSSLEKERQNPNTRPTAFGTKVCGISISVLGVYLVLVAIYSAVILSPDFNQVHSGNKENDRGMDV